MHYGLVIVLGIGGVILLTFLCCALFMWLMNRRMAAIQSDLAEKHYEEVENMYQQMWGWRHGGIESLIGKGFDEEGILFSGGERQKIAIARALYKDSPFILLDEPTAALDPVAEYEVYSAFDEMVQGKTAIYISHRLSSCRFCDDIVVFDQGEAVQRGSHGALMADREGLYYALYTAQAQYYESNAGQKAEC
ncbi:MAG: ATP-binding cassette domain-containing protein [Lachnospiraceae bacterium]|jgi:ABC-type multidrug transport system fused ATPase/permease subunit|nr:ATP-binding cassette domain-containing protein [Lachnospiraceae bacterium]